MAQLLFENQRIVIGKNKEFWNLIATSAVEIHEAYMHSPDRNLILGQWKKFQNPVLIKLEQKNTEIKMPIPK